MIKKKRIGFEILFLLLLVIIASGCNLLTNGDGDGAKFKKGSEGLIMEFVQNYPGDKYLMSDEAGTEESIFIVIDVKNKGTFPEGNNLGEGGIYISGFDDDIIKMETKSKSLSDPDMFLPAASPVNPLGGFSTVEFEGKIIGDKIRVDEYTPTILATVCYPYATKASPTVCVDPFPFDNRQEKVCNIGSQTLSSQGSPVAVTKIEQEAATGKIQFKIHIEHVGNGDVIKPGLGVVRITKFNYISIIIYTLIVEIIHI